MAAARGDTWLVNPTDDRVEHILSGPEADIMEAEGWKAFPTQATAEAFSKESFTQRELRAEPGGSTVANAVTAGSSVNDFLGRLTEKNTWIRVAEFAVGGILLFVGLKAMFPGAVGAVTSGAKKAAEIGAIA